ncbi:hypothetical protein HK096_009854 [Nowakowskiella sp. JEL0078]|nr:hypothetical protein HK096_009854 [Nowakowskiella sp. JEL0078]
MNQNDHISPLAKKGDSLESLTIILKAQQFAKETCRLKYNEDSPKILSRNIPDVLEEEINDNNELIVDPIACACEIDETDGEMIECTDCTAWSHMHCYGFFSSSESTVPGYFSCYSCQSSQFQLPPKDKLKKIATIRRCVSTIWTEGLESVEWISRRLGVTLDDAKKVCKKLEKDGIIKKNLKRNSGADFKILKCNRSELQFKWWMSDLPLNDEECLKDWDEKVNDERVVNLKDTIEEVEDNLVKKHEDLKRFQSPVSHIN